VVNVIIILIAIGLWLFLKGGAVDQGAALFRAVGTTSSINKNLNAVPYPGNKGLPCLVGSTIPQIKVMSPNGGETFTAGQQITVTWSTCNIPSNAQIAILLKDEVNGTNSTGFGSTNNDGSEMITLPASSSPFWNQSPFGQRFKIKVNYKLAGQSTWTDGDSSDNLFTISPVGVTVAPVGSPTLTLYQAIDGVAPGEEDVFLAKFRFNVTANNDDVFISKDIANIGYTRLGNGTIDAIVLDADDDSIDDGLINSYRVDAGNTEQFTLSFFVRAHDGSGKFTFNSFKYGMSDGAGSDDYVFTLTPPLQTPTVYLAK
jgi:hypothetical protein